MLDQISQFLDEDNKVKSWPAKRSYKYKIIQYLSHKIQDNHFYSEKDINLLLSEWHTFNDPALLRRELFECKFLDRTNDGKKYWKP